MILMLAVCLAPGVQTPAQAELPPEQLHSLFNQANEAFRQANAAVADEDLARRLYEKAILNYEKIINDGRIRNARLYYNLANAYFLKEDIARAILNYRRAERLNSSDTNIQKNLAFARSKTVDRFQVRTRTRVLQTLFFWHYDLPITTRFFLTCLTFAATCVALTVMVWFGRSAPTTAAAVVCAVVMLCLLASVTLEAKRQSSTVSGVITAGEVVARQGDGPNYPPSFKESLHAGTEFDLLERRPGWLHVQLSDDADCWIPDDSAELT